MAEHWAVAPRVQNITRDDVHIWRFSLDRPSQLLDRLIPLLSEDERQRSQRLCFAQDSRRYILCRGLLRCILGRYLNTAPQTLVFSYSSTGKPEVQNSAGLQFNLTHSENLALIGIARDRATGVDLEYVQPVAAMQRVIKRICSPQEQAIFATLSKDAQLAAFYTCWTRKEAYLKATGEGFGRPLDQVEVSFIPGSPAQLLRVHGISDAGERWSLHSLHPAPGYIAAIAVAGTPTYTLSCWDTPLADLLSIHADR